MSKSDDWQLIQDNDCHWYVIQVRDTKAFYKWVEAQENCLDFDRSFDEWRISGPHTITFPVWTCSELPMPMTKAYKANPAASKAIRKLAKRGDRKLAGTLKPTKKGK